MTIDERNAKRAALMDEDMERMDRIKAEKGEDHRDFWMAMQFSVERVRQFDARHPVHSCAR